MSDTFEFADKERWFVVSEPAGGVYAIRESVHDVDVRSYLVVGSERAKRIEFGMGDAMAEVIEHGRTPDEIDDHKATHRFDEFGIYVRPDSLGIPRA